MEWESFSDKFNNNMRVSITDKCNLSCFYCNKEGVQKGGEISLRNYQLLLKSAAQVGIYKIKLVGGEPTTHECWREFILEAKKYIECVGITTNGTTLNDEDIQFLNDNEIRVNVSIPSISNLEYEVQTKSSLLEKALHSAMHIRHAKVNTVITKKWCDDVLSYFSSLRIDVKALECRHPKDLFVSYAKFKKILATKGYNCIARYFDKEIYCNGFHNVYWLKKFYGFKECKRCKQFPCGEGMCYIRIYSDGSISRCIYGEKSEPIGKSSKENWISRINEVIIT